MTQAHEVGDRAQFSGYIWSESLGWRFLSRIELKADAQITSLYSFVEQWVAGEDAARSARYGPTYMSDASAPTTFQQIDEATFSYGTLENHLHVNAWECAQNSIAIATGGDTVQGAASGTSSPLRRRGASHGAGRLCGEGALFASRGHDGRRRGVPCGPSADGRADGRRAVAVAEPHHVAARPRRLRRALGSGLRRRRNDLLQRLSGRRCWRRVRARCLCGDPALSFQRDVGRRASDDAACAGRGRRGAGA